MTQREILILAMHKPVDITAFSHRYYVGDEWSVCHKIKTLECLSYKEDLILREAFQKHTLNHQYYPAPSTSKPLAYSVWTRYLGSGRSVRPPPLDRDEA